MSEDDRAGQILSEAKRNANRLLAELRQEKVELRQAAATAAMDLNRGLEAIGRAIAAAEQILLALD